MTYIANLDLAVNSHLDTWTDFSLASDRTGVPIRYLDGEPTPDRLRIFIREATGLIISMPTFLEDPRYRDLVLRSLLDGKRAMVLVSLFHREGFNSLLLNFDVSLTTLGLYTSEHEGTQQRIITASRAQNPAIFRHGKLLRGVASISIVQPNVLNYGYLASPVFVFPPDQVEIVDMKSDFPVDWKAPEIASVVLTGQSVFNRNVLVVSGNLFLDTQRLPSGLEIGGMHRNETLAHNVISWLSEGSSEATAAAYKAYEAVDAIERYLAEFVEDRLVKHFGTGWWSDGVPEAVKDSCDKLRKQELNKLPPQSYLMIVQLKKVIEKHRELFEDLLTVVGTMGGKAKPLHWMDELNEIRKKVMHPSKRFFARGAADVTSAELVFLEAIFQRITGVPR